MPAYLSPLLNDQQCDANGAPLSGGRIYTYKAGTSTPIATYTDADGLTPQSNPIVLNSAGRPDSPIWLPAGQAVKLVLKTSADVLVDDWDDVTGINDPSLSNAVDQWVTFSGAPTYISATSFSVQGDQTGVLQVGRRLKTANTGGTIYSSVTASAYDPGSGLTTVTVANDSGSLDSGLSLVTYGLLSVTNPSMPTARASDVQDGTSAGLAVTPQSLRTGLLVQTAVTTTSGTAAEKTSIPWWATEILVDFAGVSTSGTANPLIQIGDSGGYETAGYNGVTSSMPNGGATTGVAHSTGFTINSNLAANVLHGQVTLRKSPNTNTWTASGSLAVPSGPASMVISGSKTLSDTLDRVRVITTDAFDAGSITLSYR